MQTPFKTIGLCGRIRKEATKETFEKVLAYLSEQKAEIILESNVAQKLSDASSFKQLNFEQLGQAIDLLIVIGGDGSLLEASHAIAEAGVPIVGINRGRLGFLADIDPDEAVDILPKILAGEFQEDQRFFIEAESASNKQLGYALNDIVLISGDTAHMTSFEIYVNDEFMSSERSDGLIIATPTGSTAYALSAGGPIVHPALNALILVPMFSHTLSARPIVLSAEDAVTIRIGSSLPASPKLSFDGEIMAELGDGETFTIRKKQQPLRLLHPVGYRYFDNLGRKLHWGKPLGEA